MPREIRSVSRWLLCVFAVACARDAATAPEMAKVEKARVCEGETLSPQGSHGSTRTSGV